MPDRPRKSILLSALFCVLGILCAVHSARAASQSIVAAPSPSDGTLASSAANPAQSSPESMVTTVKLPNGLTFLHKQNTSNRIVGVCVAYRTGSAQETAAESGLANLTLAVMRKGTESRKAQQIAETIESLGISLSDDAGEDFCSWSLVSTLDDLDPSLDLLADILLHPSFPPDEIENERQQVLAGIRMQDDDKFAFTYKNFRKTLYAGHPYARPVEGEPETVSALTRDQMIALHRERLQPSNMIVSIVGDLDVITARRKIEERLGGACPATVPRLDAGKEFVPRPADLELRREAKQSFLCIGYTTTDVTSPDYPALRLTSAVLGEGMSARLFIDLRDRQGLAYAVGSFHRIRRQQGHITAYIGTKPETLKQARDGILEEFDRLKREPVGDEELTRARNYAMGRYLMGHQTNSSQAYFLAYWEVMGMSAAFDTEFPQRLEQVTSRDIMKVANKYFLQPAIVALRPEEKP